MTHALFDTALAATRTLWTEHPILSDFAPWSDDLSFADIAPQPVAACTLVQNWQTDLHLKTEPLHRAIAALTPYANWQQTYSREEVGDDFLTRYGWFELIGPGGHFHSAQTRAYIAYWGENLWYPWHLHEAEEIYYCISGQAQFSADGLPDTTLTPGQTRFHKSNQPHAMQTHDAPILTLVLWRGPGMTGVPRLGTT